jgi:hypothetical protein
MSYFTQSCPRLYVKDIERTDLLKFSAFLRDEKELRASAKRERKGSKPTLFGPHRWMVVRVEKDL